MDRREAIDTIIEVLDRMEPDRAYRYDDGMVRRFFWIHGAPAKDTEQVISYLMGDAHDQSKVQVFTGVKFIDVVPNA